MQQARFACANAARALSAWQAGELGNSVEALLVAVKATNDFETEMAERFGGGKDVPAEVRLPDMISSWLLYYIHTQAVTAGYASAATLTLKCILH